MAPVPLLTTSVKFNVRRSEPVFVRPISPTPREQKRHSDLDHEGGLSVMVPFLAFYSHNPRMTGKDPAKIIKEALAKVLVFYYPMAGTIRQYPDPDSTLKLYSDCTGEGALFIEADADISLSQLGHNLHPPFPYLNEVLYEVPGMCEMLNCPVLNIQVTRLTCGGFILGVRYNEIMMDATGVSQFGIALAELARGASEPSVLPTWDRDRFNARKPPRETCIHPEFEEDGAEIVLLKDKAYRLFYFSSKEIDDLKKLVPHNLKNTTSFELISGFIWRCRTIGLQLNPEEEVRLTFAINARDKFNPPFPKGFYGYAIGYGGALTTAGELCENYLGYAVELVKKAKENVTEEHIRSFIDGLVLRGWPRVSQLMSSFFISDLRKMAFLNADFGWGKPFRSCPAFAWYEPYPQIETYFFMSKNDKGEPITVVSVCLPPAAMNIMEEEIYSTLKIHGINPYSDPKSYNKIISSNL